MTNDSRVLRTIDVKADDETIIKPGELIDIIEITPLTLHDRRIYDLLLQAAWSSIEKPVEHCISKSVLRGKHEGNDRVEESIVRLMKSLVSCEMKRADGRKYVRRIQLLGTTDTARDNDGKVYYRFPDHLREVIIRSEMFARLRREAIFAFRSKYSLALYEMLQKRGNMRQRFEVFELQRFRQLLGIPDHLYTSFKNLNLRLKQAQQEVNGVSEFNCEIIPIYQKRRVVQIRLEWSSKEAEGDITGAKAALKETQRHRVGRRARLAGTVEQVDFDGSVGSIESNRISESAYQKARAAYHGWDIDQLERRFYAWRDAGNPTRGSTDAHFLSFAATHTEKNKDDVFG